MDIDDVWCYIFVGFVEYGDIGWDWCIGVVDVGDFVVWYEYDVVFDFVVFVIEDGCVLDCGWCCWIGFVGRGIWIGILFCWCRFGWGVFWFCSWCCGVGGECE